MEVIKIERLSIPSAISMLMIFIQLVFLRNCLMVMHDLLVPDIPNLSLSKVPKKGSRSEQIGFFLQFGGTQSGFS